MAGEIMRAFESIDERKTAIVGKAAMDDPASNLTGGADSRQQTEQKIRAMFSGFDLDFEELDRMGDRGGAVAMILLSEAAAQGHHPGAAMKAFWMDAVLIGLLIAEDRERAAA